MVKVIMHDSECALYIYLLYDSSGLNSMTNVRKSTI